MAKKILVTSYANPDLDGVACSYAYSEFLKKKGFDAVFEFFGSIQTEVEFVVNAFNIKDISNGEKYLAEYNNVVFVDGSRPIRLPKEVNADQVIEVIDHRKTDETDQFINASIQVELVGSCATLIAEKYFEEKVDISKESAALLYSAIVSNTLNFKAKVTTERDGKMAEWLQGQVDIPENYIEDMFLSKSSLAKPVKEVLLSDFKDFQINDKKIGITQLEIIGVDEFVENNLNEIKKALLEVKKEKALEYIILNCLDLEKGFTLILVADDQSEQLVSSFLNIQFNDEGFIKLDHLLLRKEIIHLFEEMLSK